MSYDLVEIAGRVQRLERDNRRLKLGSGALVAVLVAVPLVGAVLPEQVPEVIEARAFRVLDENGTSRTFLGAGGLGVTDEQGELRAGFTTDRLAFYDEQGEERAHLDGEEGLRVTDEQGTRSTFLGAGGLVVTDEQGTVRAHLGADSLGFVDEQETLRLRLGRVTLVNQRTEAETTYPAALVLYDEEGAVIESLPR